MSLWEWWRARDAEPALEQLAVDLALYGQIDLAEARRLVRVAQEQEREPLSECRVILPS